MKRAGNLFEKICDIQNLHEVYYKASKNKRFTSLTIGNLTSQFFAKGLPAKTMILFFGKKLWARDSSGAERSKGWRAFAGRPLECNHG